MPVILTVLIAAAGAIYFFATRARGAADATSEILDMANDVRLAARRFGFRRNAAQHPVETIDDPKIAIAGIAEAFLELDTLPSQEQRRALDAELARHNRIDLGAAEELTVLGRWIVTQCGSPQNAVTRLARKLYKMEGPTHFEPLMNTLARVTEAGNQPMSAQQKDVLDDIARAFRINR